MTVKLAALGRSNTLRNLRAAGRGCRIDVRTRRIAGQFSGHGAADRVNWRKFRGCRNDVRRSCRGYWIADRGPAAAAAATKFHRPVVQLLFFCVGSLLISGHYSMKFNQKSADFSTRTRICQAVARAMFLANIHQLFDTSFTII